MQFIKIFLIFFSLCFACSPALRQQEEIALSYRQGRIESTELELSKVIQQEMPKGDYRQSGNAVWLLLDRATARFAMGNVDQAIDDYKKAFDALDYYAQDSTADLAAQILLSETAGAYVPWDYEQVLARAYFALALLQKKDFGNAYAILRNAEEWQQKQRRGYARTAVTKDLSVPENALTKYLLAALAEKQGDISNAQILYREVAQLTNGRINQEARLDHETGTLMIVCHNGHVPQKISQLTDARMASAIALEIILSASGVVPPALSSIPAMPTLTFQAIGPPPLPVEVTLLDQKKCLQSLCNIERLALCEAKQKEPLFLAKSVARFILRRAAVGYCQRQDPLIGMVADIGMTFANIMTTADTRSWNTLPNRIDTARFDLPPGKYKIKITLCRSSFFIDVDLKPNELSVVNLFV